VPHEPLAHINMFLLPDGLPNVIRELWGLSKYFKPTNTSGAIVHHMVANMNAWLSILSHELFKVVLAHLRVWRTMVAAPPVVNSND
jgi:hypothetical protein